MQIGEERKTCARRGVEVRLAVHHIESVSGGRGHPRRGPHHGRYDRGRGRDVRPRRVLDTRPPYSGLRPVRAHAFPSNIRSSRRQPETAGSTVFSFEAIPFGPRHRPRVSGGSDGGRLSIIVACGMPAGRWAMRTRAGE